MDCQDWKPVVLSKKSPKKPQPSYSKKPEEDGFTESPKMFTISFGRQVERLRMSKHNWTRQDLAKKMNVKENVIENIEKGKEVYNGKYMDKLKTLLGNELTL